MTPICWLLTAVTVVFAAGCIAFRRKGKAFEGMMCKFMASFGFISVAVVGYCFNPVDTFYFCLMCFSLLFGFFGDVLLGIKEIAPTFKSKLVPLGTIYFLAGHVFCLVAFMSRTGFNIPAFIVGFCGIFISILLIKIFKMKMDKKTAVIMITYYSTLIYQVASSCVLAFESGEKAFIIAFVGSILFFISDSCIALLYFTPIKKKNIWVTVELSTYYPAQILLAMSAALIG